MTSEVFCGDAFDVLPSVLSPDDVDDFAIVTSLPDADEMDMPIGEWLRWFREAARLCCSLADPVVFYQTDRRHDGMTLSKAAMVMDAATTEGAAVRWHKIALRAEVGSVNVRRPTFAHLVAVGRGARPGRPTPDVIPNGPTLYSNGMSIPATEVAIEYVRSQHVAGVVDPFCGYGTVLRVAEAKGVLAIGIDIDPEQCERARTVQAVLA